MHILLATYSMLPAPQMPSTPYHTTELADITFPPTPTSTLDRCFSSRTSDLDVMGHEDKREPASCRAKKNRPATANPLQAGILSFLAQRGRNTCGDGDLLLPAIDTLPKRFTLYPPALFLPGNFATHGQAWTAIYEALDQAAKQELFASIAQAFSGTVKGNGKAKGTEISHIAINAAIPATIGSGDDDQDNTLRSPCRLLPVYGDFGPAGQISTAGPTQADFDAAFWLSTSQDAGITQVWAPRWTMFSRGNVREKARILGKGSLPFPGLSEAELGTAVEEAEVLDMYVGIGYFAFSYLKRGLKRVWGWDLNPWSIEGLRRGCERNGWRYLLVELHTAAPGAVSQPPGAGLVMQPDARTVASTIAEADRGPPSKRVRCVAFLGNNEWAAPAIRSIEAQLQQGPNGLEAAPSISIRHVNLGLLPSSHPSWRTGVSLASNDKASWLHVHENVGAGTIEHRAAQVAGQVGSMVRGTAEKRDWTTRCDHVEQVKSFGPGVVHCVFDISMTPPPPPPAAESTTAAS